MEPIMGNSILSNLYGHAKTASGESIPLDQISAAEFLNALESGEIEEVGHDFSDYSDEELQNAYSALQEEEEASEKLAGDTSYWETAGRVFARSYLSEVEKVANEESDIDLNNLSVEEFINFAAAIEQEME